MSHQLRTRIALSVSLLTLGFMALVVWLALSYFEEEFKAATFSHFSDSLAITAEGISGRIEHAQATLRAIRQDIPPAILDDRGRMQEFLDQQGTGLQTFDNGIILFSPDGPLLAVNPRQDDVLGMDFSSRDYIKVTRQSRRPYISAPFISRQQHRHPILMLTEPVLDRNGEVAAILGGSFDLYGNNFLKALIDRRLGKHGYYLLVDQRGTLIVHPERDNILRSAKLFFSQAQFSAFSKADSGNITGLQAADQEMIGSFRRIKPLDWTLVALFPSAENLRPIHLARIYLCFALAVLSVITVLAVRLLSNRLTSPLIDLTDKVRRQVARQDEPLSFESARYQELGDLADSIQILMDDVTAQRRELKDQLAFLQNLIDTIPGPIFYKDVELRYLGCNRAFEEYVGIRREQLIGRTTFDIAPAELARVYHRADLALLQQGGEQKYEASVKYADGSIHEVIFYKKVFRNAAGEPAGMIGTFLDITERKQSELALRSSERRFRLLVENAADAFFLHDEDGLILDVNQQACLSLGYSRNELLRMKVADISVDFDALAFTAIQPQLKRESRLTVEDRHRCKDGSILPVEVRLCYTEQDGGLVIALARDISERKKHNEALEQALHETQTAKQQVDNILSSTADGLVVTNRRYRVTHINQIAEQILKVRAEDVMGRPFTRLFVNPQLREQARVFLNNADLNFRQIDFKINLSEADFPRIIEARSSLLRTESGKSAGVVTLLRDVSRERELDQIKSEFISTAAHEMRTPVAVIMGYIELLLEDKTIGMFPAEQQREFLAEAYHKGEALAQIVDDLFDISRIEAGLPLPVEKSACDLHGLIRDVIRYYENNSSKHRFKTVLDGKAFAHVDCSKMSQVFENLVSNAVKYSPEGGEIEVESVLREGMIRIDVVDQGSGMSAEQLERIFDKFYRADSSDTAVRGLGLGMSIVKAIVEAHEGTIRVASAPGQGTRVTLEIPLTPAG